MTEPELPDIAREPHRNPPWAAARTVTALLATLQGQMEWVDRTTLNAMECQLQMVVDGIETLIRHLHGPRGQQIRSAFVGSTPAEDAEETAIEHVHYSFLALDTPAGDASTQGGPSCPQPQRNAR